MTTASNSRALWIIPLLIAICLVSLPAQAQYGGGNDTIDLAETSTYVFLSDQSTVVKTGGFAGIHETYPIQGQFQLTVDANVGTASFDYVDAFLLSPISSSPPQSLGELFNMTELQGTVVDDAIIDFVGKTADGMESDILLTLTFRDDSAHLAGRTVPPPNSTDFPFFELDAVAKRKYDGGTGEPNNPYQIATAEDLMLLGESPDDYDKHFILTADIDLDPNLPGRKVFDRAIIAPNWKTPFAGVFDGNGYTISHLAIVGESYLGLFGLLEYGAEVRNLGVVHVNITGTGTGSYLGGLAGANGEWEGTRSGIVSNCYTTGVFSGTARNVGGLVGLNLGTVTGCYSAATVSGDSYVGGLIGWNPGTVIRCQSGGTISGEYIVGGLVGASGGNVTQCRSTASVSGADEWVESVGGLVGASSGTIAQCYSTAKISRGGGLVGWNGGFVTQCYSTGMVGGTAGGLVGSNEWGTRGGTLHVGYVADSLWDTQASGQTTSDGGTGKTTIEMQTATTFLDAGWDFVGETTNGPNDVWKISEGLDYPRLWWEEFDGRVSLELGEIFAVTLESNPSTGYRWEWVENQGSILEQIGEAEFKPSETGEPPLVGAGGWEIFRFTAVSAGQMTLRLVYRRPWEEGVEPLKTFSLQVTVP